MKSTFTPLQYHKYRMLLYLFLFFICNPLFAQVPVLEKWDRRFGGNREEIFTTTVQTLDGGYLLGGYTNTLIASGEITTATKGKRSYWIVKTNADGTKAWDKTFGSNDFDVLTSLVATADGGFLLGGTTAGGAYFDKTEASKGNVDYWIIKVDANGNKEWDKTFGGIYRDELTSIIETPDGGVLIGGYSDSAISEDKTENSKAYSVDFWVIKLNADGSKAWDRTIGGNSFELGLRMVNTQDGGYLLGGTSLSDVGGDKSQSNYGDADYWIVKLDQGGNKMWDKSFGGTWNDIFSALVLLPDGGFLLGGSSESEATGNKTEENKSNYLGEKRYDFWVIRINSSGEKIWDKTVGGNFEDRLSSIALTVDGDYMLGGVSSSGAYADKTDTNRGGLDYWVVRLHPDGSKVWDKSFGGNKVDKLAAIIPTTDNGFILGGSTFSSSGSDKTESSRGGEDYWIVKINETGKVLNGIVPVTKVWDKRFGGYVDDKLAAIVTTPDGGYLLGGSSNSSVSGDKSTRPAWDPSWGYEDYWIIKLNPDGTKKWDRSYGGAGNDILTTLIKTPDGGYLLGGYSSSAVTADKTSPVKGYWHYWIVKIDINGNKEWDRSYGSGGSDYLSALIPTLDGGYLIGGNSRSNKGVDKTEDSRGDQDYWVIKIDKDGDIEWDKTIGGNSTDVLTSLIDMPDGGYMLGGYSTSVYGGDKTTGRSGEFDYWIVKLDSDGSKVWDNRYGNSGDDRLTSIVKTQDGNYLLGGHAVIWNLDKVFNKDDSDYWIVKIDSVGNSIWDKTFGGYSGDELKTMIATSDGGFLLGGESYSQGDVSKSEANRGESWADYWAVKITPNGTKEWDKTYGGSGIETQTSLAETVDGNYIIGGYTRAGGGGDKTQEPWGGEDFWLIKFRPEAAVQLATTPTAASSIIISEIGATSMKLTFNGGDGVKRIVLARQQNEVNISPINATTYSANSKFGKGQEVGSGNYVVFNGIGNEVTVTGLRDSTKYHFTVFEYNDYNTKGAESYLDASSGRASQTTLKAPDFLALKENFDYSSPALLTDNGWTAYSDRSNNAIPIAASGLTYTEYTSSGIGNSADLKANGEDDKRIFTPINFGKTVYTAFMVRVASVNSTGDIFLHLGPYDESSTNLKSAISVRSSSAGKIQFGIGGNGVTQEFTSEEFNVNTTYLLVIKYNSDEMGSHTTLYVNPNINNEPQIAQATITEVRDTKPSDINFIALRQGVNTPVLTIDGIRIATSYFLALNELPKKEQAITFKPLEEKTYGIPSFDLIASSTSNLPITFSLVSGPATINGNMLTLTGAGKVRVKASQTGSDLFNPATDVEQEFCVNPATPIVEVVGMDLRVTNPTTGTTTYQWYKGSTSLENAINDSYIATEPGSYKVVALAGECMSQYSEEVVITPTGIKDNLVTDEVLIYPVPATTTLHIEAKKVGSGKANISIYDLTGRQVFQQQVQISGALATVLNVRDLGAGMFTLMISTPKGYIIRKIILE